MLGSTPAIQSNAAGARLAELVAAASLITDLGIGQPMGFALRGALLAVRLGETLQLGMEDLTATYYVALLRAIGCNADAADLSAIFGDELSVKRKSLASLNSHRPAEKLAFVIRSAGNGLPPLMRTRLMATVLVRGEKATKDALTANCEVAEQLAPHLGLGEDVQRALGLMFERWDGKGSPGRVRGVAIPTPVRIVQLARDALVFDELGGVQAAVSMARGRSGKAYDPEMTARFCERAKALLDATRVEALWEEVLEAEPGRPQYLAEGRLDDAVQALGYFADLKSAFLRGHSSGVAELAAEAARHQALPPADVALVRRAGYVHDAGRTAVSNAIWDKPGPLSLGEWEQVQLHPYYVERAFARSPTLAPMGNLAAMHHERLDGSGYHRKLSASDLPVLARILAAADVYHALTEPRPHRGSCSPEAAAEELRHLARLGRLEGKAVDAVLEAAGHRVKRRPSQWPAGLTEREVEVIRLVARGLSNRQMAEALTVSDSTIHHHVQHIYDKIGMSTRAAATLFAMQHGLLGD